MTFPCITSAAAGLLLPIQMALAFAVARLFNAGGLSKQDTNNPLRLIGGLGTYLTGFALASALIWAGLNGGAGGVQP